MIAAIIPTRNRKALLLQVLSSIERQIAIPDTVIIVDSSDIPLEKNDLLQFRNYSIQYIHTKIRSAAAQKNMGLDLVPNSTTFLAFLDDDVEPDTQYLLELTNSLLHNNYVGISGLAVDPNIETAPLRLFERAIKFLFLLWSPKEGKLLKSGIAIPVKSGSNELIKVSWLIGCSVWKYQEIKSFRFSNEMTGQSVGEDVIFSATVQKYQGNLAVNTGVILKHFQSSLERPNRSDFWEMWARNRKILIKDMGWGALGWLSYYWANLGQIVLILLRSLVNRESNTQSVNGIVKGTLQSVKFVNEN